jgi:molybdenum cofactor cytidylyltransferase
VKTLRVDVRESAGRVLCSSIFRQEGRKLLAKGHVLSEEDVRLLDAEGLGEVWVAELEDGETGEEEVVRRVAEEMGCGALEIRLAAGGRANLFANEDCCSLVDEDLLRQINSSAGVVIATMQNFRYIRSGDRVATVKSAPFAIPRRLFDSVMETLRDNGPILQARPIRSPSVAVLYTDPSHGDRARGLFEPALRQKLERYRMAPSACMAAREEESMVANGLQHLLRGNPTVILVASTQSPAGPEDPVGRAMSRIGCQIERFLAPVEPGNLLLLGYYNDVPIVSAPGCYRSPKLNVIDLVLPPMLARYRVSSWEVACLGLGGLLA